MKNIITILLVLINIGLHAGEDEDRGYIVSAGDAFPEMELQLINGETINTKELDGKVVMLQFTASWCSVCRKEMPFIESEIWQEYKDREDFVLIGIDRDEPIEKINGLIEATGVTYPIAFDEGAEHFQKIAHEKAGITRNIIIDKQGNIAMLTRLFEREEFDEMKAVIAELLEGEVD